MFERWGAECARVIILLIAGALAALPAASSEKDPPSKRPGFSFLRQNEDWSVLSAATGSEDHWDPIKYVPLTDDEAIWASFGATFRLRGEGWSDFAFGAPTDADDEFVLGRVLAHADLHLGEYARVFVEAKSALAQGRDLPGGTRTLDEDTLDLQQGFVDLSAPLGQKKKITVRLGRRMFLFGRQRLISPLPWSNTLRAWDGADVILESGRWKLDTFVTRFVPVRRNEFNRPDDDTRFWGSYATRRREAGSLEVYAVALELDDPVNRNGTMGNEDRYTLGARVEEPFGVLDLEAEGAYQFGSVGSADVSAWMLSVVLGRAVPSWSWKPRFQLGLDYASGDDAAGGDVGTFNQLFPLGHAYFGIMDFVGRQNIVDVSPGVSLHPTPKMGLTFAVHMFRRAESADALYNAGGAVVRPPQPGSSREVGTEVDAVLGYRLARHLKGELGLGRFGAGDFIEETGAAENMDFVYLQLLYSF